LRGWSLSASAGATTMPDTQASAATKTGLCPGAERQRSRTARSFYVRSSSPPRPSRRRQAKTPASRPFEAACAKPTSTGTTPSWPCGRPDEAPEPQPERDWQDIGGSSDGDVIVTHQRCRLTGEERTIETPRELGVEAHREACGPANALDQAEWQEQPGEVPPPLTHEQRRETLDAVRAARLATNMQPPHEVSPEEMAAATEEARELRNRLDSATSGMEGTAEPVRHASLREVHERIDVVERDRLLMWQLVTSLTGFASPVDSFEGFARNLSRAVVDALQERDNADEALEARKAAQKGPRS